MSFQPKATSLDHMRGTRLWRPLEEDRFGGLDPTLRHSPAGSLDVAL
jgi:hypothetical protein